MYNKKQTRNEKPSKVVRLGPRKKKDSDINKFEYLYGFIYFQASEYGSDSYGLELQMRCGCVKQTITHFYVPGPESVKLGSKLYVPVRAIDVKSKYNTCSPVLKLVPENALETS